MLFSRDEVLSRLESSIISIYKESSTIDNLFVLEGPDGSGKTTLCQRVVSTLKEKGIVAEYVKEPGTTKLGEELRSILLDRKDMLPTNIQFNLFTAARLSLLSYIREFPNTIFILDRYLESTIVYQTITPYLKKIGWYEEECNSLFWLLSNLDFLKLYVNKGILGLPVKTFLLNRNQGAAWKAAIETKNVYEEQGIDFHITVNNSYRLLERILQELPIFHRYVKVDNNGSIEEAENKICEEIISTIEARNIA